MHNKWREPWEEYDVRHDLTTRDVSRWRYKESCRRLGRQNTTDSTANEAKNKNFGSLSYLRLTMSVNESGDTNTGCAVRPRESTPCISLTREQALLFRRAKRAAREREAKPRHRFRISSRVPLARPPNGELARRLVFHQFHIDHMAPYLPPKMLQNIFLRFLLGRL